MKKSSFITSIFLLTFGFFANSADQNTENSHMVTIKEQTFPFCSSNLVKQLNRFEKTPFTVPRRLPTGKLKDYALRMELLCPWQLEYDFNGDTVKDWIGIIKRNNQFELVAYLSGKRKFDLQVLHQYQFFPEQSYIKVMKKRTLERLSKQKFQSKSKYAIQEVFLNETSRIYLFIQGKMTVAHQYQDVTELKTNENNREIDLNKLKKGYTPNPRK